METFLQSPILTLSWSNTSLNVYELPLFTPWTNSQSLKYTLESTGPICKSVLILVPNYCHSVVSMVLHPQKYWNLNRESCLVMSENLKTKQMHNFRNTLFHQHNDQINAYTYMHTLRPPTQCKSFMGNLFSLGLESGPLRWEFGILRLRH